MLDYVLRFMTLGTLVVGSIAIYAALHTNNRRLGADIFLRYSDRSSDLRRSLPITAFVEQSAFCDLDMTPEERQQHMKSSTRSSSFMSSKCMASFHQRYGE